MLANFNIDVFNKRIVDQRMRFWAFPALALIFTLLFSIYVAKLIVAPLRFVTAEATRASDERKRFRAIKIREPDRRDEIGDLNRAVSKMTNTIERRMGETIAMSGAQPHQLQNILYTIKMNVRILQDPNQSAETIKEASEILKTMFQRSTSLINDLKDLAEVEKDLFSEEYFHVDVSQTLSEALAEAERSEIADKRHARVSLESDDSGSGIVWGRPVLREAFKNVILNAIKFSPPNGDVRVFVSTEGNTIQISVEDEGKGIPEHLLVDEHIFTPFVTTPAEGDSYKSSGLGLFFARKILEYHGGRIEAMNRTDREGAVFVMTLPSI